MRPWDSSSRPWCAIQPASPLEEAVLEKASRMQARIDPGDGARLRALAGWMAHQGLEEESQGLMINSDQSQI